MQSRLVISAVAVALVVWLSLALAQDGRAGVQAQVPEGWNPCPRCQNNADRTEARARNNVANITDYDRRDLSGVWGYDGVTDAFRNPPPLTEDGQAAFERTWAELRNSNGEWLYRSGSEKDYGLLDCASTGLAAYAYLQLRVRVRDVARQGDPVLRIGAHLAHHLDRRTGASRGSSGAELAGMERRPLGRRHLRCRVERIMTTGLGLRTPARRATSLAEVFPTATRCESSNGGHVRATTRWRPR